MTDKTTLVERAEDGQEIVDRLGDMDNVLVTDWSMNPETPDRTQLKVYINVKHD